MQKKREYLLLRIHEDINLLLTTNPKQHQVLRLERKKKAEWFLPHIDMSKNQSLKSYLVKKTEGWAVTFLFSFFIGSQVETGGGETFVNVGG